MMQNTHALNAPGWAPRPLRPPMSRPPMTAAAPPALKTPADQAELESAWEAKWAAQLGAARPLLRPLPERTE